MAASIALKMGQRGVLTLPKDIRDSYKLEPGDEFSLLDLGGVFVISPRRSEIDGLADRVAKSLADKGESLESMLMAVREEREKYGRR